MDRNQQRISNYDYPPLDHQQQQYQQYQQNQQYQQYRMQCNAQRQQEKLYYVKVNGKVMLVPYYDNEYYPRNQNNFNLDNKNLTKEEQENENTWIKQQEVLKKEYEEQKKGTKYIDALKKSSSSKTACHCQIF